jgi:hypothetical protein
METWRLRLRASDRCHRGQGLRKVNADMERSIGATADGSSTYGPARRPWVRWGARRMRQLPGPSGNTPAQQCRTASCCRPAPSSPTRSSDGEGLCTVAPDVNVTSEALVDPGLNRGVALNAANPITRHCCHRTEHACWCSADQRAKESAAKFACCPGLHRCAP